MFDAVIAYISPLVITDTGLSKTMMGIIVGSSSIAGAFFDFALSKFLRNTNFRRLYLVMFIFSFATPLILWQAKTIWIYLIAMGSWGLYFDLFNFGNFDFVSRRTKPDEHSSSFGVIDVFKALGYLVSPIIVGMLIGETVDFKPFVLSWIFLGAALVFFILLIVATRRQRKEYVEAKSYKKVNVLTELKIWQKVGRIIFPTLAFTMLLYLFDSFFWTVGPLLSESLVEIHPFGGFFMAAYTFPTLFVGWFIGPLTAKFGRQKTASLAVFFGALILASVGFMQSAILIVLAVFLFSTFASLAWPAIEGIYADYITEAPIAEREIEGVVDFFINLGYIVGPMIAGFLADSFGNTKAFTILGLFGALTSIVILKFSPKKIYVPRSVVKN